MNIRKIDERVYLLQDDADCIINLVVGDKYALVFDTGLGSKDLIPTIKSITDLPLLVINSHGHFDHTGGNYLFDRVYLSKEDFNLLDVYSQETLNKWYLEMTGRDMAAFNYDNTFPLDFDSFDLGNLKCQIIPLPGHTIGSIGILIPQLKILLSGDALLPVMTLNFYNHLTRDEQLETLKQVQKLDFKYYLTSHHTQEFNKEIITDLIKCIENSFIKKAYDYQYPKPPYSGVIPFMCMDKNGFVKFHKKCVFNYKK